MLLFSIGCARSAPVHVAGTTTTGSRVDVRAAGRGGERAEPAPTYAAQRAGDFAVYRFTGTYRKTPLTLSEAVLEATGARTRVELTLDDGKHKRTVRARYDRTPGAAHEIDEVVRVGADGVEQPMTREKFDAMMAETAPVVDANEETLEEDRVTIDVAGKKLACARRSFRVVVGKKKAIMTSLTSDDVAWGDVGGEIKTDKGGIVYHAELVDLGSAKPLVARVP